MSTHNMLLLLLFIYFYFILFFMEKKWEIIPDIKKTYLYNFDPFKPHFYIE